MRAFWPLRRIQATFVLQDIEICIPDTSVLIASYLILHFRLFESLQIETFDNYNEKWTSCITLPCTLTLLSDKS